MNDFLKNGIHHVGFVVEDAEHTYDCLEAQVGKLNAMRYDFKPMRAFCYGKEVKEYKLKIIMISMGDEKTNIEIIQPISNGYHHDVVVNSSGGGIHHICFAVSNYDEVKARFERAKAKIVFESETEDEVIGYRRCFYAEDAKGNVVEIKENPYFR